MAEVWERERNRLNERIRSISGTELAKELRSYRHAINKRENILARGAKAVVMSSNGPKLLKGNRMLRAHDELPLLHRFLDERGVATCNFGFE